MLFRELPIWGRTRTSAGAKLRLPLGQLLQNLLKLLGRIVHSTAWEEVGEKAAGDLVEVGVRNSSIVVLVVLVRIHGLLQRFGAGSFPTSIVEITRGRSGRL